MLIARISELEDGICEAEGSLKHNRSLASAESPVYQYLLIGATKSDFIDYHTIVPWCKGPTHTAHMIRSRSTDLHLFRNWTGHTAWLKDDNSLALRLPKNNWR